MHSNIQGIEAKNKIYSSFQLKWVASWFSAFANTAALVKCFDIGRLHDRMHFPNKHCLFYLLSYATCVFCKILCLKNEKSLFEGDFISLHHFGLNLITQIMCGCVNHCFMFTYTKHRYFNSFRSSFNCNISETK